MLFLGGGQFTGGGTLLIKNLNVNWNSTYKVVDTNNITPLLGTTLVVISTYTDSSQPNYARVIDFNNNAHNQFFYFTPYNSGNSQAIITSTTTSSTFIINSAYYYSYNNAGGNVTTIIQQYYQAYLSNPTANSILNVNNISMGGDTQQGTGKTLWINATTNGNTVTYTCREGANLDWSTIINVISSSNFPTSSETIQTASSVTTNIPYVYTMYFYKVNGQVAIQFNSYSYQNSSLTNVINYTFLSNSATFLQDASGDSLSFGKSAFSSDPYYTGGYSQMCVFPGDINSFSNANTWLRSLITSATQNSFTGDSYNFSAVPRFYPVTVALKNTGNLSMDNNGITLKNGLGGTSGTGYLNLSNYYIYKYVCNSMYISQNNYVYIDGTILPKTTTIFTLEMWIFPMTFANTSSGITPSLIGDMTGAGINYWTFGPNNNGGISFYYYNGTTNGFSTVNTISLNTWSHIALTSDGNNYYIYINGVRDSNTLTYGNRNGTTNRFIVGKQQDSCYYTGLVSNIRITNTQVYSGASLTPPINPLTSITGSLLLAQSNGTILVDNSPNQNTLVVSGSPIISTNTPFYPLVP